MSRADQLLARYPVISDQVEPAELKIILTELESAVSDATNGDVVEMGCYAGTTSLFIRRLLDQLGDKRAFHVYDSFAGLPEKSAEDSSPAGLQFKTGELSASKKDLILNFKKADLKLPVIHKGWFSELTVEDLPDQISFAFLDGDYYHSITDSLRLVWPKLVTGSIVVVDDYQSEALPGARRAVDDWLALHPAQLRAEKSLAIIQLLSARH